METAAFGGISRSGFARGTACESLAISPQKVLATFLADIVSRCRFLTSKGEQARLFYQLNGILEKRQIAADIAG